MLLQLFIKAVTLFVFTIMKSLGNSILVQGYGSLFNITFDQPVDVAGKKMAIRSIYFPRRVRRNYFTKLRVRDSHGQIHIVPLDKAKLYRDSGSLMRLIYKALIPLCSGEDCPPLTDSQESIIYNPNSEDYSRNRMSKYPSMYQMRGRTEIVYNTSGLRIIAFPGHFENWDDNVFGLLREENTTVSEAGIVVDNHSISSTEVTEDPGFVELHCNVVNPSLVNNKQHFHMESFYIDNEKDVTHFAPHNLIFHDFSVGEIMDMTFVFLSPEYHNIEFSESQMIVISIIIR